MLPFQFSSLSINWFVRPSHRVGTDQGCDWQQASSFNREHRTATRNGAFLRFEPWSHVAPVDADDLFPQARRRICACRHRHSVCFPHKPRRALECESLVHSRHKSLGRLAGRTETTLPKAPPATLTWSGSAPNRLCTCQRWEFTKPAGFHQPNSCCKQKRQKLTCCQWCTLSVGTMWSLNIPRCDWEMPNVAGTGQEVGREEMWGWLLCGERTEGRVKCRTHRCFSSLSAHPKLVYGEESDPFPALVLLSSCPLITSLLFLCLFRWCFSVPVPARTPACWALIAWMMP